MVSPSTGCRPRSSSRRRSSRMSATPSASRARRRRPRRSPRRGAATSHDAPGGGGTRDITGQSSLPRRGQFSSIARGSIRWSRRSSPTRSRFARMGVHRDGDATRPPRRSRARWAGDLVRDRRPSADGTPDLLLTRGEQCLAGTGISLLMIPTNVCCSPSGRVQGVLPDDVATPCSPVARGGDRGTALKAPFAVRWRGLEHPRPLGARPSTLRVFTDSAAQRVGVVVVAAEPRTREEGAEADSPRPGETPPASPGEPALRGHAVRHDECSRRRGSRRRPSSASGSAERRCVPPSTSA